MNTEFDLDNFKEDFQNAEEKKVSSSDLKKMLNKSTITNAKYILLISILEFVLGTLSLIYTWYEDKNYTPKNIEYSIPTKSLNEINNFVENYYLLFGISYVILLLFICYFFYLYKKLQVNTSIKIFTKQILNFRRAANVFIIYNVVIFVVFWIVLTQFTVTQIQQIILSQDATYLPEYSTYIYIGSVIALLVTGIFMFIYYRFLWGMFLRRMKKNQKELESLEE